MGKVRWHVFNDHGVDTISQATPSPATGYALKK